MSQENVEIVRGVRTPVVIPGENRRREMPDALIEGYGLPPLSVELKQAILGGNIARILGLDLAAIGSAPPDGERQLAEPWSG